MCHVSLSCRHRLLRRVVSLVQCEPPPHAGHLLDSTAHKTCSISENWQTNIQPAPAIVVALSVHMYGYMYIHIEHLAGFVCTLDTGAVTATLVWTNGLTMMGQRYTHDDKNIHFNSACLAGLNGCRVMCVRCTSTHSRFRFAETTTTIVTRFDDTIF